MRLLIVLFLSIIFSFSGAFAAKQKPDTEEKLQNIRKQLQESKKKLKKTKKEEAAVLGRLVVINKELKRTQRTLSQAKNKINTNKKQVGVLQGEVRQETTELEAKEKKLKNRLREVYKNSGLNYFEVIFSARSMSDFFNRVYFFRKIVEYDAELVAGIRQNLNKVQQKKNVLEAKTKEIQGLTKVIAKKEKDISSKAGKKKKIYDSLKRRTKEYEARVAELEKSSKELEVLILKKMAGRKGGKVLGSGTFSWPLRGRITSRFGYRRHPLWGGRSFHTGLDIANKHGTPVKAADSGEVIFAGWWDGYGKAVVVDHGRRLTTVYAHLSRIYKGVGAIVAKGQIVGLVGSTGYSTGPHLHFEVRKEGKPINPLNFLK